MWKKIIELKLPLILLAQIGLCLLFGQYIAVEVKSFFLTISSIIKSVLMFVLPVIIFSFVSKSVSELGKGAVVYISLLLFMVCASNFISTCISGGVGFFLIQHGLAVNAMSQMQSILPPLVEWQLKPLISNDAGMLSGLVCGALVAFFNVDWARKQIVFLQKLSLKFLSDGFIKCLPLFVLGFVLKMEHEGVLATILAEYSTIFLIIGACLAIYLWFFYGVATNFKISAWSQAIKSMLPAALTGFSAMSSAAALPLILLGAEKNVKNPEVARGALPMTVNIHLIGCDFTIPMLSLAVLHSFGIGLPDIGTYLIFVSYFVLAKFAVAAVPAGGIIVMLPVLEKYLGFTPEMLSLITALYVLFDPIVTSANVLGNGGFAILFSRVYDKISAKLA